MDNLKILGLVLELNPPHKGHEYFIKKAKEIVKPDLTIAVMSSSFSQRGEIIVVDKFTRSQIALENGIDLLLELPFIGGVAGADYFCYNAIKILTQLKITDLAFGVELDNLDKLKELLSLTSNPSWDNNIKAFLDKGFSYSTACNKSLSMLTNDLELITNYSMPNNTLGLQYMNALSKLDYSCNITLIKRIENNYFDNNIGSLSKIASAQALRNKIQVNENINDYIINHNTKYIDINKANDYLYHLLQYTFIKTNDLNDFKSITGVDEGIENRIYNCLFNSNDYNDFIEKCITKRYTINRIRRILLNILLEIKDSNLFDNLNLDYLRILGFNNLGEEYISNLDVKTKKKIITTFKHKEDNKIINIELKATKLYGIITNDHNLYLQEYLIPIRSTRRKKNA